MSFEIKFALLRVAVTRLRGLNRDRSRVRFGRTGRGCAFTKKGRISLGSEQQYMLKYVITLTGRGNKQLMLKVMCTPYNYQFKFYEGQDKEARE